MNLKNYKFYKRIQELRRTSKLKSRHRIDGQLENALRERDTNGVREVNKPKQDEFAQENMNNAVAGDSAEANTLIQLNDVCFRLKCTKSRRLHKEDDPIASANGSICVSHSRYVMIGKISKALGFKLVKETKLWNILWTDSLPGVELYKKMKRFQQINHFPGMMDICRKDLLSRNLNRMLKLFPRDYKIFPKTWIFPADYGDALNFASNNCRAKTRTFIIKPDAGAQGRGIWLTNDLKTINPTDRMICQTYINRPLLIDGYKFDLRVYTLITSVDPLRIFVYNEGLARFATNKYVEPSADNASDLFMHLTNYSVNKRSSQYDICDNDDCGSKRTFSAINSWLQQRNYDVVGFWNKIDDIIIKTVLSSWPMLKHNYHACFRGHDKIQACFEILGFDILVDSKLKPYILEVNHSPSFHTNELVDRQVKKALIRDTLQLIRLADKKQIMKEDRTRVKQRLLKTKEGVVSPPLQSNKTESPSPEECALSPMTQQIGWEESHLGDFRRIMPPHDPVKLNYYGQFFALQNQASIYETTTASKKREEVAKKMRLEIEEKRIRQKELNEGGRIGRLKFEDRKRRRENLPRSVIERQRLQKFKTQEHWTPGFISDAEIRLRGAWLQMRSDLLSNMKIAQFIYLILYNSGGLSNSDILNYPELYQSLKNGHDILTAT